jgi:hypothetical protein
MFVPSDQGRRRMGDHTMVAGVDMLAGGTVLFLCWISGDTMLYVAAVTKGHISGNLPKRYSGWWLNVSVPNVWALHTTDSSNHAQTNLPSAHSDYLKYTSVICLCRTM